MSNKRMLLSAEGKEILDNLVSSLELERPTIIKIALAKAIAESREITHFALNENKNKWTIPDNIIKDQEYLLFKHLIIERVSKPLNEEELHKEMISLIESGLRILSEIEKNKSSIEDLRLLIL